MKTVYYPQDDILELRFSDKAIVREAAQDWNVAVSYAEDDSIVEIALIDADTSGLMPFQAETAITRQAA